MISKAAIGICAAVCAAIASAYEIGTHQDLTEAAAIQSLLGVDPVARARIGLRRTIDSASLDQKYPDSNGQAQSVLRLLTGGAAFEDDSPRPAHHFFDPRDGRGLHIEGAEFPLVNPATAAAANAYAQPSPDWVLGQGVVSKANNRYTWASARDYMYYGLTLSIGSDRRQNWGSMFESLGRAVHHIQDMAQPQHVRNDAHWFEQNREAECLGPPIFSFCDFYLALHRDSAYERWTNRRDVLRSIFAAGYLSNYPAVYPGNDVNPAGLVIFSEPRRFWTNNGLGMADFTNRNFFSENTIADINGTLQPTPAITSQFRMKVGDLCLNAVPPCMGITDPEEWVYFWSSSASDQFRPAQNPMPQPFAAGESIFSPEFDSQDPAGNHFLRLNRFTFAYDQLYLLPRAIGYSAGLINYFFRGNMQISLPDEGVYAIADQSPAGCGAPCGFRKLKLKIMNVTAGNEVMGAGVLTAVVKYHRNLCYRSDLAGEYGGDPAVFTGNTCRFPDENVAVSQPVTVSGVRADQPQLVTFYFDAASPIPMSMADAYLQVVFRGKLGQEDDAVAVTTKDIAEPNYLAIANITDFVYDDTSIPNQYYVVPHSGVSASLNVSNLGVSFGGSAAPIVTMPSLSGGQHAQIAFLTDVAELPATVFFSNTQDTNWILQPEEFTQDDATGKFARSCTVFLSRGVYREYEYLFGQSVSDHGGIVSWQQLSVRRGPAPAVSTGSGGRLREPEIAHDCSVPTGGKYDFTPMNVKPFTAGGALPWTVGF